MKALALLLCAAAAFAAPDFERELAVEAPRFLRVREGFRPPESAPPPVAALTAAVPNLKSGFWASVLLGFRTRSCSGFFVSDKGHLLTAAHCLRDDFPKARDYKLHGMTAVELPKDVNLYPGRTLGMRVRGHEAEYVAVGRGVVIPNNLSAIKDDPAAMARLRALLGGDWAIVKVRTRRPTPCVSVGPNPAAGERLWHLGYPGKTLRPSAPNAPGGQLRLTDGPALKDLTKAAWFEGVEENLAQAMIQFYQPALDAGDIVVADADSNSGMSGGPVFEGAGRAVGIMSLGWSTSKLEYYPDSAVAVSVDRVKRLLSAAGVRPETIFDCPAPGRPAPQL